MKQSKQSMCQINYFPACMSRFHSANCNANPALKTTRACRCRCSPAHHAHHPQKLYTCATSSPINPHVLKDTYPPSFPLSFQLSHSTKHSSQPHISSQPVSYVSHIRSSSHPHVSSEIEYWILSRKMKIRIYFMVKKKIYNKS